MNPSVTGRSALLVVTVLVLGAAACAWLFLASPAKPDEALLARRMKGSIVLGWGWLHAEKVSVIALEKQGDNYAVSFDYVVILDKDEAALSPQEQARFRQFLPMCSDLPIARGTSCPLQEEMTFVNTREHGWMPELFIRYRPEMLPAIAAWTDVKP